MARNEKSISLKYFFFSLDSRGSFDRITAYSLKMLIHNECRGNSSVGRAQPCQGWGREFESRFPLHEKIFGWVAEWLCSGLQSRGRRFDSDPSLVCPGGGTGRRKGLKIPREVTLVPVRFRPRAPFS